MAIIHATGKEYDGLVKEGTVLVDFYAEWCGPCKMLVPVLENLDATRGSEVKILKINVDEEEALAQKYGVMSIPTIMLYKNGSVVSVRQGYHTLDMLNEWIDNSK